MQELLPLAVFPEGGLSHSVITCVWVGVFVVVFFNLRFGWVLSGLVVPGYLAPLLLVKPLAAAVVIGESIVTFGIVYLFSERASRLGLWPNLFGRDRFFALLLVSVLVRVVFDGYLLPDLGNWLDVRYGLSLELRNDLHSFGLIIVCLLANQYWKTGLVRGLVPALVCIGLTWLIIRVVLMPLTNFSIGALTYVYEDIAASILSSPKSYLILLLTALLASRMNLRYGWDYNGILIPSLLALQWYQPEKILASFVEALVICALAVLVLRLPILRHANIEGGRKLLLFFNLSFAWKLLLGHLAVGLALDVKVTDLYGFGYLLPTLLAIKMHDATAYVRVVRTTAQTSLTAMVVAGTLAFGLSQLPRVGVGDLADRTAAITAAVEHRDSAELEPLLQQAKIGLYEHLDLQDLNRPFARDLEEFDSAVEALLAWRAGGPVGLVQQAANALVRLDYRLIVAPDWVLLIEQRPGRGWGTYLLNRSPTSELVLEVPGPLEQRALVEAALALYHASGAQALAIAGTGIRLSQNTEALATLEHNAVFQVFHRRVSDRNVLQLRGDTPAMRRSLQAAAASDTAANRLWVNRALPEGLDARLLNATVGEFDVVWRGTPLTNVQREHTGAGFAELVVDTGAARLLQRAPVAARALQRVEGQQRIDGYLAQWLLANKHLLAARGSEAYTRPQTEELLYFENQILVPMFEWNDRVAAGLAVVDNSRALAALAAAAEAVNYRVVHYRELGSGHDFVILAPDGSGHQRHWGIYVARVGGGGAGPAGSGGDQVVQIPRPLYESGSFEFGITLFDQLGAGMVLIAGAHPLANADGSADVIRLDNRRSLFNLVSQARVRHAAGAPLHIVQVRTFGYRDGLPAPVEDVLISAHGEVGTAPLQPSPALRVLLDQLDRARLSRAWVDGGLDTVGYEAHFTLQARHLEQARGVELSTLWLSPWARRAYRQQSTNRQLLARLEALDLQPAQADLFTRVRASVLAVDRQLPDEARALLAGFQRSRDVVRLFAFRDQFANYHLETVTDANSQQTYLLVHENGGALVAVVNLGEPGSDAEVVLTPALVRESFRLFVDQRAAWLRFASAQLASALPAGSGQ